VGLAEVGERPMLGPTLLHAPPQGDLAVRRLRKTATRTPAGASAGAVERQERTRSSAGAPCRRRSGPVDAACGEVTVVAHGLAAADRMVRGPVVVEARREDDHGVAGRTVAMAHAGTPLRASTEVACSSEQR